jgi:hypothetical protein
MDSPVNAVRELAQKVDDVVDHEIEAYSLDVERPLRPYAAFIASYASAVAGGALLARRRGVRLPERVGFGDLALLAVATHKVSRLLSKESIGAVVRAPFTEFVEPIGAGEVNEKPRGTGVRHALGELFGCPFCLGQWVGTAFVGGWIVAPRATRAVASVFAVVAASDSLHFAYAALQRTDHRPTRDE